MENRPSGLDRANSRVAFAADSAPLKEAAITRNGLPGKSATTLAQLQYRLRELSPVGATLGLGSFVLLQAPNIRSRAGTELGPQFWPEMLGWSLIGLGLVLVLTRVARKVRQPDVSDKITPWGAGQFAVTAVVLIGYLLLWNVLQFWLITIATITVLCLVYGVRGWKPLILFPAIVGLLLHILFVLLLRVPL